MGTVVSFPRVSGVPDKRHGVDRRRRPRGGRRAGDQQGFAPLVLLVDEDAAGRHRAEAMLAALQFAVAPAHTEGEALRVMDALRPNLIVARVADAESLRQAAPEGVPIVILTEASSAPEAMLAEIRRALRRRTPDPG